MDSVTYKEVALLADKLKQEGIQPNITDISEALGAYNDTDTIASHLEQWYRDQPEFQRTVTSAQTDDLNRTLSLVRATLESTADGILMINKQGEVVDWNQKFVDMWRLPVGLLEAGPEGPGFAYVLDQVEDPETLVKEVTKLYDNPNERGNLGEVHFKDGRVFQRYSQPHVVDGEIVGRVWSFRDITEQRHRELALKQRERAITASPNGIFMLDIRKEPARITYINPAFERISGFDDSELLGETLEKLLGKFNKQAGAKKLALAIKQHNEQTAVLQCQTKLGKDYWAEINIAPVSGKEGEITHFVGIMDDITERKAMEEQLLHQATYDSLTNLPNRSLLLDRLDQSLIQASRNHNQVAVMFLDLDRFKMVNDSMGHSMGDKLLQMVGSRLLQCTKAGDTVSRIGGDEFVVIVPNLGHLDEGIEVANRILQSIDRTYHIDGQEFKVTSSVGLTFYPKDGKDVETLLKNADLSMYSAKDAGRNTIKLFREEMQSRLTNRISIEKALRSALKEQEFTLNFQPLVDLNSGEIVCTETLLRWNSKELGFVSPVDFIPVMEENGQILEVGEWVLENACKQTKAWYDLGYKNLKVAVNLSAVQFKRPSIANAIKRILERTGLPPQCLELEITETMLVENIEEAIVLLEKLKSMGVSIAVDDFGTGYSSLSYLKRFPIDKLKIDRSFVTDVDKNENNAAITNAIINLGHSLLLKVVAEGVETEEEQKFLRKHNCDYGQGYLFAKPCSANEVELLLQKSAKK